MAPSPPRPQSSYLTPTTRRGPQRRNSDTSSIHSVVSEHSEQDTDSEDDSIINAARTSAEIRAHDRNVLFEEEERDRILTEQRGGQGRRLERRGSGLGIPNPFKKVAGKIKGRHGILEQGSSQALRCSSNDSERPRREARRQRRAAKRERLSKASEDGEDRGLLYEMEEGSIKSGSETGSSSDSEGLKDGEKEHLHHDGNEHSKTMWSWKRWLYVAVLILLFLALLVLGAWKLSTGFRQKRRNPPPLLSNGTDLFLPTTIYISLDGFRADYIDRGVTPNLLRFMSQGVAPPYMNPSFPSVTFPNHYTLATGLYPESHGIVANKFWDQKLNKTFYYTDTPNSMAKEWWSEAEPIWITAERNDVKTAVHMWPGSEALISDTDISYLDKYESKYNLSHKVDRVLELLDVPGPDLDWNSTLLDRGDRPQLIMSYVPNVDSVGHKFGPESSQVADTLKLVDDMLGSLLAGIEERNLTGVVNVVIVSDHGMAESSNGRLVEIEELIDMRLVEHVDGWPLYGLRPHSSKRLEEQRQDLNQLERNLSIALKNNLKYKDAYQVYFKEEIPERYNWRANDRIAPLWIIPSTGWAIVTKEEFDVEAAKTSGVQYHPKGIHGYDHEDPLMRAIFAARGPAFIVDGAEGAEGAEGSRMEQFQNIEVYNLICDSVGLDPLPNNGTLRLPLGKGNVYTETKPVDSSLTSLSSTLAASTHLSATHQSSASAITSISSALSSASTAVSSANQLKKPPVTMSSIFHSSGTSPSSLPSSTKAVTSSSSENVPMPNVPIPTPPTSPSASPTEGVDNGEFEQGNGEEKEEGDGGRGGLGGLWDWVKGAVGGAVDFVGGLLPDS